jgi:Chaperone of endosialidase
MPHSVAQEHLGMVDAIRYGTARTHATLLAANAAIGSTPTVLVLTHTGDGVWTIGANVTMPGTTILRIPPGVTVNVLTGVTFTVANVIADRQNWKTGPGTLTRSLVAGGSCEVAQLTSNNINCSVEGQGLALISPVNAQRQVVLSTNQGAGAVSIELNQGATDTTKWEIGNNVGAQFYIGHPGASPQIVLTTGGMALTQGTGLTPSYLLHLTVDSAAKPGAGGLWSVPSSRELKTLTGTEYKGGMAKVRQLPPVRHYRYNGLAGTPADASEECGFIAEELQAVAPELVRPYEAKLTEADETATPLLATNLGPLLFTVLNALRELDARLATLEQPTRTPEPHARPAPRETTRPDEAQAEGDAPESRTRRARRKD